jgi:acyl-CoA thioesterase-2
MNQLLKDLVNLLDLETLEVNLFRGQSRDLGGKSVFGGQVIGQALVAATRTVPHERLPHSLHAYFLRPGDMDKAIVYEVDRVRDGRSFTTRRIQAIQAGEVILSMIASFQIHEEGFEHQALMPPVPPPESLRPLAEVYEDWLREDGKEFLPRLRQFVSRNPAIEFRPVAPQHPLKPEVGEPVQHIWFRAAGKLPDEPLLHRCVLAYASDFFLLGTCVRPHGFALAMPQEHLVSASLDHALWFHRDLRVDDWLLYATDSPSAQNARGFNRGLVFDRGGRLVASTAQEGLIRPV